MKASAVFANMTVLLSALCLVLTLAGCASAYRVDYEVETDPPGASVDVNGTSLCDRTPCRISLSCAKTWVGLVNSPDGWASRSGQYEVVAIPNSSMDTTRDLYSDRRMVNPCQLQEGTQGRLRLHLGNRPVHPAQPIDLRISRWSCDATQLQPFKIPACTLNSRSYRLWLWQVTHPERSECSCNDPLQVFSGEPPPVRTKPDRKRPSGVWT